jgi:hypothetical protein
MKMIILSFYKCFKDNLVTQHKTIEYMFESGMILNLKILDLISF